MLPSDPIENRLLAELDRARVEFHDANKAFNGIVSYIPSGIPQPDGAVRIRLGGEICRQALSAYIEAQREFAAFKTRGEIPARMKAGAQQSS